MTLNLLARLTAGAGLAMGLASCQLGDQLDSRPNVGPCPVAAALYDASRLVEVNGAERHETVGFTGIVEGVQGFCRYVGPNPITMELEVDFALGRGPAAEGDRRTYDYFVTVTRRDRTVLAKERFSFEARWKKGETEIRHRETLSGIVIPRATETVSGTNFEVLVGFELTPEQLAFNRSGKRFTMNVQ